jgi:hypothetical protein
MQFVGGNDDGGRRRRKRREEEEAQCGGAQSQRGLSREGGI